MPGLALATGGAPGASPARLALAASAALTGRGEALAVVDAGNRFDPYAIAEAARRLGLDPNALLERTFVSRAFTAHQVAALVERDLPAFVAQRRIGAVLALGLLDTVLDEAVREDEAARLLDRCLRALRALAGRGVRVLAVECDLRRAPGRPGRLFARAARQADRVIELPLVDLPPAAP